MRRGAGARTVRASEPAMGARPPGTGARPYGATGHREASRSWCEVAGTWLPARARGRARGGSREDEAAGRGVARHGHCHPGAQEWATNKKVNINDELVVDGSYRIVEFSQKMFFAFNWEERSAKFCSNCVAEKE